MPCQLCVCFFILLTFTNTKAENLLDFRQTPVKAHNPKFSFYYLCQFQQAVDECRYTQDNQNENVLSLGFKFADGKNGKNTSDCSVGGSKSLSDPPNWKCTGRGSPIKVETRIGGSLRLNCTSKNRECVWKREKSVVEHDGGYVMDTNITLCHRFFPNVSIIDIGLWKCVVPASNTNSQEEILSAFQLKNTVKVLSIRTLSTKKDVPAFNPVSTSPSTIINTIYQSTNVTYTVPYMWIAIGLAIFILHVILMGCCCYFYGKSKKSRVNEYSNIQLRNYETQPDLHVARRSIVLHPLNNREMSNVELNANSLSEVETEGYLKPMRSPPNIPTNFEEKILDRRSRIIQSHTYEYVA